MSHHAPMIVLVADVILRRSRRISPSSPLRDTGNYIMYHGHSRPALVWIITCVLGAWCIDSESFAACPIGLRRFRPLIHLNGRSSAPPYASLSMCVTSTVVQKSTNLEYTEKCH